MIERGTDFILDCWWCNRSDGKGFSVGCVLFPDIKEIDKCIDTAAERVRIRVVERIEQLEQDAILYAENAMDAGPDEMYLLPIKVNMFFIEESDDDEPELEDRKQWKLDVGDKVRINTDRIYKGELDGVIGEIDEVHTMNGKPVAYHSCFHRVKDGGDYYYHFQNAYEHELELVERCREYDKSE